ncbi:calcium/proton exchanger [Gigaspora margarita]|uniref:Vacuolar calcium ion transporter n=1 Tax=Gigaspora margarita TaxID=4874 RepID=A0A8H3ZZT7_GIGMA|nr:calcium/proton exchanger [Gigaspora margarita]
MDEEQGSPPTFFDSLKAFSKHSYFNALLIFIPLGIVGHFLVWSDTVVFVLNFLAIIPLADLLTFATEEIAKRAGPTVGGLLSATFGNAIELIISIIALDEGLIRVVQASILGSILSNLLLVQGFCFLFGGIKYKQQNFNMTAAQTSSSLLALTMLSLVIPAAYSSTTESQIAAQKGVLILSHGTAILLLLIYILYLFFQLRTHKHLFDPEAAKELEEAKKLAAKESGAETESGSEVEQGQKDKPLDKDDDKPTTTISVSIAALIIITGFVTICAEFLVDSIDGLVKNLGISTTFVGLILIPIVGNAAEHVSSVTFALKNKMDLCIQIALGSSMQIALGVTPVLILIGWIINQPLTLFFETFETCVLVVSVLIVNYLIQDGESNWLEGAMLLASYGIIGLAFYFYPETSGNQ